MPDSRYANIRDILGELIGRTVVDVTQHDKDQFDLDMECFVQLHFDDGSYVKFHISDKGFDHNVGDDD